MKKRVILLGDERKAGVRPAVEKVRAALADLIDLVAVDLDGSLDFRTVEADLVVIFGGDGSLLYTARRMGDRPIPSIGVNFGKFGFLTDIRASSAVEELSKVFRGECETESRLVLEAKLTAPERTEVHHALNEFYLGPSTVGRVVTIELLLDGVLATTYRGDGLVVATPTGSTGHSLSAGGPILNTDLDAIILTPVSPHSLTNRPLVIPADTVVRLSTPEEMHDGHGTFSVDGQVSVPLHSDSFVEISAAPYRFPIVRTGLRDRYRVLRERLGWSGHPPYEEEADGED